MNTTPYDIAIIGGAFAIVGALIGTVFSYHLARHIATYKADMEARNKFRSAILNEFSDLYPVIFNWPKNITERLDRSFPVLQAAVESFRPSVKDSSVAAFNNAWHTYHRHTKNEIPENCHGPNLMYSSHPSGKEFKKKYAEKILHEDITELLKFTGKNR